MNQKKKNKPNAIEVIAGKMPDIIESEHNNLRQVADLLASCPHVIPAGIGVVQYFEELKKGSEWLIKHYLKTGKDMASAAEKMISGKKPAKPVK